MRNVWFLMVVGFLVTSATGETKVPRLSMVHPGGGQAGSSFELTLTGQDLEDFQDLHFSFPGAKTEILKAPPLDEKAKKAMKAMKGGMKAGPQTSLKVKVTLPKSAPTGIHDVRIVSKGGISNPRAFVVSDLPATVEKEPNDDVPQAQKLPLESSVFGIIATATDVDYFQFTGKKGQRVVLSCWSSSIDSRLPVALQLYTSSGKFLGFNRNYQNNDAVLDAVLPEDGDYMVRVFSFSYTQGGADYSYRLIISTAPWIDAVIPSAIEPGKDAKVTILGRNLPGGAIDPKELLDGRPLEKTQVTVKAPTGQATGRLAFSGLVLPHASALSGFEYGLKNASGASNPQLMTFARGPMTLEKEPNDRVDSATALVVPGQATGRIERAGDVDWYKFTAKKGQVLGIELLGDRLGIPLDLKFTLKSPKGTTVTTQDENPEIMSPQFFARTEDPSYYRLSPAEDGEFAIGISSSDNASGPRHVYTLRVAPEEPDFQVVAMPISNVSPDSAVTGPEGNYAFTIFVWRLGNFAGDVTIQASKLPPGVTMKPQVVSASQKQAAVVVSVAPGAPSFTGPIQLEAHAVAEGKKLVREVRAATITYAGPQQQQNTPLLARLDRQLVMAIRDQVPYALVPSVDRLVVQQGENIKLGVKLTPLQKDFKATVQLTGVGLPPGLNVAPTTLTAGKDTPVAFDTKKGPITPGNYTLILRGQTQPVTNKPPTKPAGTNLVEHTPPIQLTIVPKQVLKLRSDNVRIQRGMNAEATVQWSRLYPVDGMVEVELAAGGPKGIKAVPVKAKVADDQAKLRLETTPETPAGQANLTVRVTARFNDLPIVHETKLTVTITK